MIYETAPIGLAFLSTDCRYLLINQHLTEICGISVADHIGKSVRETVPNVADDAVARLVGIEGGVVSGVFNLESSGVRASDWRPRHDKRYHEA